VVLQLRIRSGQGGQIINWEREQGFKIFISYSLIKKKLKREGGVKKGEKRQGKKVLAPRISYVKELGMEASRKRSPSYSPSSKNQLEAAFGKTSRKEKRKTTL